MTKKLIALLLAMMMAFALVACGGGSSESKPAEEPAAASTQAEETEAEQEEASVEAGEEAPESESGEAGSESPLTAEQEEKKQALLEVFTMAAQGHGDDGFDYYLVYNDDVSYACLMKADHDNQQCIDVTGEVTEDEDGWLTVTDGTYGYSFPFLLTQQDDGTYTITTTNDVTVPMEFVDVDRTLTNILGFEGSYTILDPTEE